LKQLGLGLALGLVFLVATLGLTRPGVTTQTTSALAGLQSLKALVAEATPYQTAIATSKPILLEFYADWCATCRETAPALTVLHDTYGDRVAFVMLDVDDPSWQSLQQQYQVRGVPHLVLLNAEHKAYQTFTGQVPRSLLAQSLDQGLISAVDL
ncbi:MAG: thioredoxin domain-containing protein, partial [Cyanobacteria bacterium P01_H01_bin.121]